VKLRYDNFQRATRDQTLDDYTNDAALIRRTAGQCLKRAPLQRRLRLLGVKVSGLARYDSPARERPNEPPPAELTLF
jgi:DNA polymerase-4